MSLIENEILPHQLLLKIYGFLDLRELPGPIASRDDVQRAAIRENPLQLEYATEEMQDNKETVLNAVRRCGEALEYASGDLQNDYTVVLIAVRQNPSAYQFASPRLQHNVYIILAAS